MMKQCLLAIALLTSATVMGELVGYWPFDEGTGTVTADVSGQAHDAVFFAADGIHYPQWTGGQVGAGAILFNDQASGPANSNHLVVDANSLTSLDPNTLSLRNLSDTFTVSMWVRRDALYTNLALNAIPRLAHTDAWGIQLALDPASAGNDPYDFFAWTGASNNRVSLGLSVPDQDVGNWYHLAVVSNGQAIKKYINGVEVNSAGLPGAAMPVGDDDFIIAARHDNTSNFVGAIDELAVWAGSYLPAEEVAKLADQTATPLTVVDEEPLPPSYFVMETNKAWTQGGWKLLYGPGFSSFTNWPGDNFILHPDNTASVWYIKDTSLGGWPAATMSPGGHYALWSGGQRHWYYFMNIDPDNYYTAASRNVENFGMAWVDPAWSGQDPNVAVFAPYISPGIAICIQDNGGYQEYVAADWRYKDYFKTYARVAAVNGEGASLRVRSYSFVNETEPREPNNLTLLGEVLWPLTKSDYEWQEMMYAYPKPTTLPKPRVWTEISIAGGTDDTRVYIDEFNPVSNIPTNSVSPGYDSPPFVTEYALGDFDKDSVVAFEELAWLTEDWLLGGSVEEPRDGGLLVNGDFYADLTSVDPSDNEPTLLIDPTGWTFTGPPSPGQSGIAMVHKPGIDNVGVMNYTNYVMTPLGGTMAAFTNEPNHVLEQTAADAAVAGQTYYVMAYVMAKGWNSWKDFAVVTLDIGGVEVATFERALSRNRWRPVYGTYTAVPADNGQPITVKIAYDNRHTAESSQPDIMYIGMVYLDTVMPAEWPEGRDNRLANGGFEEIEWMIGTPLESVYDSIYKSDNWGAWFVDNVPAPPGWLFEVPAGFNEADEGGLWASGYYGTPLPSPGMNDVCVYASNSLVLGQLVGALNSGTTYYLDMAAAVNSSEYGDTVIWPTPVPAMHIELWRIPQGVTDPAVIHSGITTAQPGYVKIAEAASDATGNLSGGTSPAAKWQLIGTTYTATAADTNVYVRVYGQNGAAVMPEFAFSDVYLSTEPRLVPGGDITFDIAPGMLYDVAGPYTCYHASLMGLDTPIADVDGNCMVNLYDFVHVAESWLDNWFDNFSGVAPFN